MKSSSRTDHSDTKDGDRRQNSSYIIIPWFYVLIVDEALELESGGIESGGIKSLWKWADSVDPRNR